VLSVRRARSLAGIDAAAWNRLDHGDSPFLEHGVLCALEESSSVGEAAGWGPHYLLAEAGGRLVGAVAAYVKTDSYGEYIFDWAWARASQRAGLRYYPKLVIAAPFTPATGRRILVAPGADRDQVTRALAAAVRELADETGSSSIHWLFTTADERDRLGRLGFDPRASYQFHWRNRGYADFEEFLARLTSRKRKQVRKERRRAREAIDAVELIAGPELGPRDVAAMDRAYRSNVHAHGGFDYLRPGFFERLARRAPERLLWARAVRGGRTIAGAIYLETERALYGRYWGSDEEVEFLHFELAYYTGIERAIARGLPLFEAGAQGEHKLLRGFEPSPTHSAHWFRDPRLAGAVRGFLAEEARQVAAIMAELAGYGPYRQGED
jgi:uncharacterized protein